MHMPLPIRCLLGALLLCLLPEPTVQAQAYYFTGRFTDSTGRPIPYVKMRLAASPILHEAGAGGEFGIPSHQPMDTAWCYLPGYDTVRTLLFHGRFVHLQLPLSAQSRARLLASSRLASTGTLLRLSTEPVTTASQVLGESYNEMVPNEVIPTSQQTTLAWVPNNNHASYSNARRFINHQSRVPSQAVRIEELWNYIAPCKRGVADDNQEQTYTLRSYTARSPWDSSKLLTMLQVSAPRVPVAALPPANIVFLIDNSGSMDAPNRLPLLQAGFRQLVAHLRPVDRVAIVTYGGTAGIALQPTFGHAKDSIYAVIDSLVAGGSTPGSNGLQLAYQLVTTNPFTEGVNKVILATDGDFNIGVTEDDALERLIRGYRSTGVTLTCLGVGMGNYKDSKIEALAKMGAGNFAYIDNEDEARKVMVEELTQHLYHVGWDASLQLQLDPKVVKDYQLIGYDNRLQALQAGDRQLMGSPIGSGQQITAMLALTLQPGASAHSATMAGQWSLRYKRAETDTLYEELLQPLVLTDRTFAEADSCFRQAALLAWYGRQLRQAQPGEVVSFKPIWQLSLQAFDASLPVHRGFLQLLQQTEQVYNPITSKKKGRPARQKKQKPLIE
jgi:Ca-activated chloride channel family protein